MAADVPRIDPTTSLREAVAVLLERGWEAGVVETDGVPQGVLGRRQVLAALSERFGGYFSAQELSFAFLRAEAFGSEALRQMWHSFWDEPVSSIMTRDLIVVRDDAPLTEAAERLTDNRGADLVVVVRGDRTVGALRAAEVLSWVASEREPGLGLNS